MVMRISQEEARAREEAHSKEEAERNGTTAAAASDVSADVSSTDMAPMDTTAADSSAIAPVPFGGFDAVDDEDEEAQVRSC
jgi:hypothetical protein